MYKKIKINQFRLLENKELYLGKYITVLSGRNMTGKSTVLGMLGNSGELKKKDGTTYSLRQFRAEFNEIFKGSKKFDASGSDKFEIILSDNNGAEVDYRKFRTAWQKDTKGNERFRIIPSKSLDNGRKSEAKFSLPVMYLGLSRLFPIGETESERISSNHLKFINTTHQQWFIRTYQEILSMRDIIEEIKNYSIGETDKKNGVGVETSKSDYLTNSAGQDNVGQILLSLLSFRKIKEEMGDAWKGGLLLIDEIDSTLHPSAQNKLIDVLISESKSMGMQVVCTTHSISLLKHICAKTAHNINNETNNNIELYYFTNANRQLDIKRNIDFMTVECDLLVQSIIQNPQKIKVYSEDEETRWFLGNLVPDYLGYVKMLDVSLGCKELLNLFNADIEYFGGNLIILDGDVTENDLKIIAPQVMKNLGNIIRLPGKVRPEQVIYDYLMKLPPEHNYWEFAAATNMTWDYFKENGPLSALYSAEKDREKYKKWFKDHKMLFDSTRLMEFWTADNSVLVSKFQTDFKQAYNNIAKRMLVAMLP